jgi:hypothetical protein
MLELTHSATLPGAVDDLVRYMQRSTPRAHDEPWPKRQAAVVANAVLGVNIAGPLAKHHAPPSPERRSKRSLEVAAPVSALSEIAAEVIDEVHDLLGQHRKLASRNAELSLQSVGLKTVNDLLEQDAKSLQSMRAAVTSKQAKQETVFDITNRAEFDDSEAGRQQLSRASKAVNAVLLQHCTPGRGMIKMLNANGEPTASVVKREIILARLLDALLPDGDVHESDAGVAQVIAHLPKRVQVYFNTMRYVIGRLKKAFDVLKFCLGAHDRACYYILSAGIAPEEAEVGVRSGMMRKVTTLLSIPRGLASVPRGQQAKRAAWDRLQPLVGTPLKTGEAVECVHGCGVIEALNADSSISIKLDFGKSVTFSSQGNLD